MAELKTKMTEASVEDFLNAIKDEQTRNDCFEIVKIMKQVTKAEPKLWGTSIVGFGSYHYKSERSRQEGDWPLTGFSPRKQNLTLYIMGGFDPHKDLLKKLGKFKTSVGCLYIKKLADVDKKVLKELVNASVKVMKKSVSAS
ncbi:MAG: DUF1801 domain-containing protein [Chloroflexi bacterium]|nr:DUF1801 domain-containing protein [Chloroflexota bacterium]